MKTFVFEYGNGKKTLVQRTLPPPETGEFVYYHTPRLPPPKWLAKMLQNKGFLLPPLMNVEVVRYENDEVWVKLARNP